MSSSHRSSWQNSSRRWFLVALGMCGAGTLARPLLGETVTDPNGTNVVREELGKSSNSDLEKVLAAGLKCRRPEDFAYVKLVAERVHNGTLPRSLVESSFFWARQQPQYPIISFQYSLRARAKKLGITI